MTSKYGNRKTVVDGRVFDSRAEAHHYMELKVELQQGFIRDLVLQPVFPLVVNGLKVATYVSDFQHVEVATGKTVVTDVKGVVTDVYRIKKKLMKALLDIDILEVKV